MDGLITIVLLILAALGLGHWFNKREEAKEDIERRERIKEQWQEPSEKERVVEEELKETEDELEELEENPPNLTVDNLAEWFRSRFSRGSN